MVGLGGRNVMRGGKREKRGITSSYGEDYAQVCYFRCHRI
jgi:hypothetical protein